MRTRKFTSCLGKLCTLANSNGQKFKSWLLTGAKQPCGVVVLQKTHWQATAQFATAGWHCVSSASPPSQKPAKKGPRTSKGTAQVATHSNTEALPADSDAANLDEGPSTTRADGVMVPLSPSIQAQRIRWKEHATAVFSRSDSTGMALSPQWRRSISTSGPRLRRSTNRNDRAAQLNQGLIQMCQAHTTQGHTGVGGRLQQFCLRQPKLVAPAMVALQDPRPDAPFALTRQASAGRVSATPTTRTSR